MKNTISLDALGILDALLREARDLLLLVDGKQRNVRRIATGWAAELRLAVSDLLPRPQVQELCVAFYGWRLRSA